MSVIATSVIILFVLIFLGFFLGKGGVIRQESIPDLSNLVIWVTLPVTVFCSIVDERGEVSFSVGMQMVLFAIVFHALAFGITFLFVKLLRVSDKDKGVWLFTGMLTNGGFIGLPLAQAVFGSEGVFIFAVGNILTHLLIFSVGLKLLTWHYPTKQKINVRKMLVNNINIAVVLGLAFLLFHIPVPDVLDQLLGYIANITSGMSMLVVGLSLSRMAIKEVFSDRKMYFLPVIRLLIIPLVVIVLIRVLPISVDPVVQGDIVLLSALPAASTQSMITEQYGTNTAAASRAVFLTTLFSVVTIPLLMMFAM